MHAIRQFDNRVFDRAHFRFAHIDVVVEEGASVVNSVVMNGALIRKGASVLDAIVGPDTLIDYDEKVNEERDGIALVVNGKAARL